jgi:predicted small lipoprotein YifL
MKKVVRALLVLATSTLVVCGVKGPPHPPQAESLADAGSGSADAGSADGGPR